MANIITPETKQTMINSFQQTIENYSFNKFSTMTKKEMKSTLSEIELLLKKYISRYETQRLIINSITSKIDISKYKDKNHALYFCYRDLIKEIPEITALLQDGYILIETLRKAFTGDEIKYIVGIQYSKKGEKNIVNKSISLAELMSYTSVTVDWGASGIGGFKLRAKASQKDFLDEFEQHKKMLENLPLESKSLYPKVREVIKKQCSNANEGNIYEVYRRFRADGWADHSPKQLDPKEITDLTIMTAFTEVKAGRQSFVAEGDYGLEQYKLLSKNPSVASLNTIGDALKLILLYIQKSKNVESSVQQIKENVFSREFDERLQNGLSELISELEDNFIISES